MQNNLLDNHFSVNWGGNREDFTEIYGLSFQREVVEFHDGNNPTQIARKLPGAEHTQNIILRRYLKKGDLEMYDWWIEQRTGNNFRDVIIRLLNKQHQPDFVWRLRNAFPVRVTYSPLTAKHAQPVIEEVELAFEIMDLEAV